jgi:hypothetical protein
MENNRLFPEEFEDDFDKFLFKMVILNYKKMKKMKLTPNELKWVNVLQFTVATSNRFAEKFDITLDEIIDSDDEDDSTTLHNGYNNTTSYDKPVYRYDDSDCEDTEVEPSVEYAKIIKKLTNACSIKLHSLRSWQGWKISTTDLELNKKDNESDSSDDSDNCGDVNGSCDVNESCVDNSDNDKTVDVGDINIALKNVDDVENKDSHEISENSLCNLDKSPEEFENAISINSVTSNNSANSSPTCKELYKLLASEESENIDDYTTIETIEDAKKIIQQMENSDDSNDDDNESSDGSLKLIDL